ncbi:MAG TPA: HAD-IIA family hydrolase [Pseudonocardiaceae bacterium]
MTAETLLERYDALLLDLDGTVYRGGTAVDGAEPAVRAAHQAGVTVRFVTNNASRSPDDVADHLSRLGIPAKPDEVSTSAQAAAGMLVDRLPRGAQVLILGTDALADEAETRGYTPVRKAGDQVAAVLQGLSQTMGWPDLAEACLSIRAGALWVACNVDATLPTERGLLPGNGALVAALVAATDQHPLVAGKPARPLMDEAIAAAGATRPLAIGDRLDTDIAGAVNVGIDSLLVLTGVATPADLLAAAPGQRPRYVAADLQAIQRPAADLEIRAHPDWPVDDRLRLRYQGSNPDPLDALRALCAAWWPEHNGPAAVQPEDEAARAALATLKL